MPSTLHLDPPRALGRELRQSTRVLVRHRDLLWQMIRRDLASRYAGSVLGLSWSIVHPLAMVVIYTVVFSRVMGARLPGVSATYAYGVYLCAGLVPWIAFQEVIQRSTSVFLDQAHLVRHVSFPKLLLHGAIVGAAAANLGLMAAIFLLVLGALGNAPSLALAFWPALLFLQLVFAVGLGVIASVVHVFFRDTAQVVSVVLQFWFWLTPIVYSVHVVPVGYSQVLVLNPLFHFTRAHQDLLLAGRLPGVAELSLLATFAAASIAAGLGLLHRFRRSIPDQL